MTKMSSIEVVARIGIFPEFNKTTKRIARKINKTINVYGRFYYIFNEQNEIKYLKEYNKCLDRIIGVIYSNKGNKGITDIEKDLISTINNNRIIDDCSDDIYALYIRKIIYLFQLCYDTLNA